MFLNKQTQVDVEAWGVYEPGDVENRSLTKVETREFASLFYAIQRGYGLYYTRRLWQDLAGLRYLRRRIFQLREARTNNPVEKFK